MKVEHDNSSPTSSRAKIQLNSGQRIELWIEANVPLDSKADHWLFLLLPICMQIGEDLEVTGTLSASALEASAKAKAELLKGHRKMQDIQIIYQGIFADSTKPINEQRATGLFFSAGLDSMFASEMQSDIDALISVWGFDIPVRNEKHWGLSLDLFEEYAAEVKKPLIVIKTNIRELSNGLLEWGGDYHGSALAGVASALSSQLDKVYISGGRKLNHTSWGTTPDLCSAFSTANQVIEETVSVNRVAKAAAIANNPRSELVRVCYRNITGLANCGTCKKCVRTRLEFDLVKATYRPRGLERKPKFSEIFSTRLASWDYLCYIDALSWAKKHGARGTVLPLMFVVIVRFKSILQTQIGKVLGTTDWVKGKPKAGP